MSILPLNLDADMWLPPVPVVRALIDRRNLARALELRPAQ